MSQTMSRLMHGPMCQWMPGALLILTALGCTDSTAVTIDVARLELTPPTATVQAGSPVALTARAFDAEGNLISQPVLRWSSSDNTIATVAATGAVTSLAAGTARIAVSSMGRSAVATITVLPRAVASLAITPAQTAVLVGRTTRLTATARDATGAALTGRAIVWTSSDQSVATVSSDGTVTGIRPGAATIVATSEGRSAQAAVTVNLPPVQTVTVSPGRDTLAVNGARQFSAQLRDAAGAVLSDRPVTWTSSNTSVAIVSATGAVTALSPGTSTITANSEGRSGTATVVVLARLASAITVAPGSATVIVGNTVALSVQITDADGNVLTGRPISFASDAPAVATVSAAGVVTAVGLGTTRIVVSSEGRTGFATIEVIPPPVASLGITPASTTINVGEELALTATARAASGAVLTGRSIEWRSGAPNVASVSASGLITALAPGTALILASSEGITATATITVRVPPVASVSITPTSPTLTVGQTVQITATARASNGEPLTGRVITWRSSNEQVAFVSSTGLVVGSRVGTATITATSEGVSVSTTVTVR